MRSNVVLAVVMAASCLAAAEQIQLIADSPEASVDEDGDVVSQYVGLRPVSTTMRCVIALTCQYFLIYTIVVIVASVRGMAEDPTTWDSSSFVQLTETAQNTVNYAPMLCVLFLAARMRAIHLTLGWTTKYGLPQWWVQWAMQVCVWAVLGQLIVVLVFPCCFGHAATTDNDGNCYPPRTQEQSRVAVVCLLVVRYLLMALLYGGFTTVCVGIWSMQAPHAIYPSGAPPVSPAATCVAILTAQYFTIYLLLAIVHTVNQQRGNSNTRCVNILQLTAYTINFAPMLCILFIAARVRALQMDPINGHPQWWAQWCFYLCTGSAVAQTLMIMVVPLCFGGQVRKGQSEGDITFRTPSTAVSYVLTGFRVLALFCLYGGYAGVIVSVNIIEHPKGTEYTPAVSPAMQCLMLLSLQFFFVYLLLSLVNLVKPLMSSDCPGLQRTLEAARLTCMVCPMLCILFISLRMRALQMTGNRGAPQGWAQDCMYAATMSVFLQLILAVLVSCLTGRTFHERSPSPDINIRKGNSQIIFGGCRLILMMVTYGCAIAIMVAFFVMTPETAKGRGGTIPILSDGHLR